MSVSRHGRPSVGHRFYRLTATGRAEIADVTFTLTARADYRNPERIVHLYNYLLDWCTAGTFPRHRTPVDRRRTPPCRTAWWVRSGWPQRIGPHSDAGPAELVDADGAAITGPVHPGSSFYLRAGRGSTSATVTMTVPGSVDGYGGRVLAGVARDEIDQPVHPAGTGRPGRVGGRLRYRLVLVRSPGEKLTIDSDDNDMTASTPAHENAFWSWQLRGSCQDVSRRALLSRG